MSTTAETSRAIEDVLAELQTWLEENWDPDLTVGEWWERLGPGRVGRRPALPDNAYGRGLSRDDAVRGAERHRRVRRAGRARRPRPAARRARRSPTHGTQEQIDLYVRDIVTGQQAWCQLFSEPGAGSDLAGLTTRAVEDGDEWVVNGQKVWTSGGQIADLGMLLARTNPDAPKHQGITYFAIDMHQPGVEMRPLREMTGHAMFNEVFLTDARVPADVDHRRTRTTAGRWPTPRSMHERAGLGAGGGNAAAGASPSPGTVAGNLGKRVGDFVAGGGRRRGGGGGRGTFAPAAPSCSSELAKGNGKSSDPVIRQELVQLHTLGELGRFNTERVKAARAAGRDIPGMANIAKLSMSDIVALAARPRPRRSSGRRACCTPTTRPSARPLDEATGNPFLGAVTEMALYAQAPPIYGGTDQIQRNIIGERVLGLPKEPNDDKTRPFSELPKNA